MAPPLKADIVNKYWTPHGFRLYQLWAVYPLDRRVPLRVPLLMREGDPLFIRRLR